MSDRHRRREASWDKNQEIPLNPKWSKSEVNDGMISGKFSERHSREPFLDKRSGPVDDDISRDRHRMQTVSSVDEWEEQYSTHPSVNSYGPSHRDHDRRKGGNTLMNRDRESDQDRPRSPYRSRSRSRDWGGTKARTGSPFHDDSHQTNEYGNARSRTRRQDNTSGSRYDDHRRDDRNQYDDHTHRRQSNRSIRIPCRFFAAGNCNRDDCRFSHDVPDPRRYDGRSRDDVREHNLGNRNRTCHEKQTTRDSNLSDSDFSNNEKLKFGEKKPWNGPLWDDVEPRGFNERSRKDTHDHDLRDKNRIRGDFEPRRSNERSHNDIRERTSHEKHKIWDNGSSRDDIHDRSSHGKNKISDDVDAPSFTDDAKFNERRSWNGPSWDDVTVKSDNLLPERLTDTIVVNDSNLANDNILSRDANQRVTYEKESIQSVHDTKSQSVSYLAETKKPFNEPNVQLNDHVDDMNFHQQTQIQSNECVEPLKPMDMDVPQASLTSQLAPKVPQLYRELNITDAIDYLQSLPSSAYNQDNKILSTGKNGTVIEEMGPVGKLEGPKITVTENAKEQDNTNLVEKVEEGDLGNDEKTMRLFKVALVEYVKEILKPRWKEGKLSREVYKNVVKKVVDKVTTTIQLNQIPRTQVKIEQYLANSKPKITKLVEAYVERYLKA